MRLLVPTYDADGFFFFLLTRPDSILGYVAIVVDIFPGLGLDVGEFVGGDAHHGAVFGVQFVEFEVVVAGLHGVGPGEAGGGPEFGPGIFAEGVQVDVVCEF